MAAADLIGLSEEAAVWALGNAGTQSSGLWQFLESGAMSKHLHTARAAESGVLAALLAKEGFTGAADILEGEKGFFAGPLPGSRSPRRHRRRPGRAVGAHPHLDQAVAVLPPHPSRRSMRRSSCTAELGGAPRSAR